MHGIYIYEVSAGVTASQGQSEDALFDEAKETLMDLSRVSVLSRIEPISKSSEQHSDLFRPTKLMSLMHDIPGESVTFRH